jgi:hypothetical protein
VTFSTTSSGANAGAFNVAGLKVTSVSDSHRTVVTASNVLGGPSVTLTDTIGGDLCFDSACVSTNTMGAPGGAQTSQAQDDAIGGGSRSWATSTQVATGSTTTFTWANGGGAWASGAVALVADDGTPITGLGRRHVGFSYTQG